MIISICYVCSPTDCTLLAVCSPTEFTEYTEPSCCIFSHRFHRFTQNLLAVCSPTEFTEYTEPSCCMFSHGIHGIHRTFLLYVLPQISQIYTEPSCCIFSHRLHRFSQMLLSRGCTCLKCTNPFCCCTSCSVGVLLALLVHLRQVHPLKAASVKICEICGRILSATSSVNSVNSVGEYLGRVISVGVLPVNLLLAMLAQIGVALREVVVAEPPATVGRQR